MPVPQESELRVAFGMTIKTLRQKAGIRQEYLAWESGVDRAYVGGLERGEHTPTLKIIYKLLPRLGVTFPKFAKEFDKNLKKVRRKNAKPESLA